MDALTERARKTYAIPNEWWAPVYTGKREVRRYTLDYAALMTGYCRVWSREGRVFHLDAYPNDVLYESEAQAWTAWN
jgi:hypothetical protein